MSFQKIIMESAGIRSGQRRGFKSPADIENRLKPVQINLLFVFCLLILTGCTNQPTVGPMPMPFLTATQPVVPPTITPIETVEAVAKVEVSTLEPKNTGPDLGWPVPNLWSDIDKGKIRFYLHSVLADYAYAEDGSLWMAGGFGIIHKNPDGSQTWYAPHNGLPNNFFTTVAISPQGEVWVGGANNTLLRFDGNEWINEGIKLPPAMDMGGDWLCYSQDIGGIDFGPDGSTWVMNNGIELYRQAYGQWINVPFPKNLLPYAGGGACPEGLRVKGDNDIRIKLGPC